MRSISRHPETIPTFSLSANGLWVTLTFFLACLAAPISSQEFQDESPFPMDASGNRIVMLSPALEMLGGVPGAVITDPKSPIITSVDVLVPRPMQFDIGMREAEKVENRLRSMRPAQVDAYLKERALPAFIGPRGDSNEPGHIYTNNGTHKNYAAWLAGIEKVYLNVMADFSDAKVGKRRMSEGEFLDILVDIGLFRNKDRFGKLQDPRDGPKDIRELRDYPARSVAWKVQRMKGIGDSDALFKLHHYADLYRLHLGSIDNDFDKEVINEAYALSRSPVARSLPGYVGRK